MFRKPTIADIYIHELQTRFDRSFVPLYPPDTSAVTVGAIGRFTNGEFERRGHLKDVIGEDTFAQTVPMAPPSEPASFTFHSAEGVTLKPSATASVGGQDIVKASLSFTGDRAVVASFAGVVEHAVSSPRDFDKLLWRLYLEEELAADEVVVAVHREAASGTVLVNRKGGIEIEVSADPSVVGVALTFANLGLGVDFGVGSQASSQTSGTKLAVVVKAKGLPSDQANRVDDVRGFSSSADEALANFEGVEVPVMDSDEVLAEASFDTPED